MIDTEKWRFTYPMLAFLAFACATNTLVPADRLLTEDRIVDLIEHPRGWDERVVTIRIFPYDYGHARAETYAVCFEVCSVDQADKSPFIIFTSPGRYAGLKGKQPIIVRAHYSSACFYKVAICADTRFGVFTERP
ncbi:MAG: hypothetical protein ABIO68_02940 [Sphingomicrobium sp.]